MSRRGVGDFSAEEYCATVMAHRRASKAVARATKNVQDFQEMIDESDVPVMVDFYATWCGPCKLAANVRKVSGGFEDDVKFVKIDAEKYPELAGKWKVEGLPTFVLFYKGKVLDRIEGLPTEMQMKDRLRYFLQQAK